MPDAFFSQKPTPRTQNISKKTEKKIKETRQWDFGSFETPKNSFWRLLEPFFSQKTAAGIQIVQKRPKIMHRISSIGLRKLCTPANSFSGPSNYAGIIFLSFSFLNQLIAPQNPFKNLLESQNLIKISFRIPQKREVVSKFLPNPSGTSNYIKINLTATQ